MMTETPFRRGREEARGAAARKVGIVDKVKAIFKKPKAVAVAADGKLTPEDMWNQIGYHRITGACSTRTSS